MIKLVFPHGFSACHWDARPHGGSTSIEVPPSLTRIARAIIAVNLDNIGATDGVGELDPEVRSRIDRIIAGLASPDVRWHVPGYTFGVNGVYRSVGKTSVPKKKTHQVYTNVAHLDGPLYLDVANPAIEELLLSELQQMPYLGTSGSVVFAELAEMGPSDGYTTLRKRADETEALWGTFPHLEPTPDADVASLDAVRPVAKAKLLHSDAPKRRSIPGTVRCGWTIESSRRKVVKQRPIRRTERNFFVGVKSGRISTDYAVRLTNVLRARVGDFARIRAISDDGGLHLLGWEIVAKSDAGFAPVDFVQLSGVACLGHVSGYGRVDVALKGSFVPFCHTFRWHTITPAFLPEDLEGYDALLDYVETQTGERVREVIEVFSMESEDGEVAYHMDIEFERPSRDMGSIGMYSDEGWGALGRGGF